jgi:hypothetical protein
MEGEKMQVTSFKRDRWCWHIGPVEIVWMRRPMSGKIERLIQISWVR